MLDDWREIGKETIRVVSGGTGSIPCAALKDLYDVFAAANHHARQLENFAAVEYGSSGSPVARDVMYLGTYESLVTYYDQLAIMKLHNGQGCQPPLP